MPFEQCPPKEFLSDFLFGRIDEQSADALSDHVRSCHACQTTLNCCNSLNDTIITSLKRGVAAPQVDEEPALQHLLVELSAMGAGRDPRGISPERIAPERTAIRDIHLGQYRLLELLGEGGMGTVYKAEHTRLEMIVAVKVLSGRLMHDLHAVARFEREMKAVGKVNHPHIVRATDAGEENGRHYLAMEFVDGRDLGQLAHSLGPLRVCDACEAIRQASIGIAHAHGLGMIHRDLKPSNLMVDRAGQVKVLDLGLARLLTEKAADSGLTDEFQIMGTADYMAPEQALKAREVDYSVDIYSLGCTLYTLLCGRPPFSGPEYAEPLQKLMGHDRDVPVSVIQRRDDVPLELSALIDKSLAKSPADRIPSAAAFADSLRGFTDGADLATLVSNEGIRRSEGVTSDVGKYVAMTDTVARGGRPKEIVKPAFVRHRRWLMLVALMLVFGGLVARWCRSPTSGARVPAERVRSEPKDKAAGIPAFESARVRRTDRRVAEWATAKNALVSIQGDFGSAMISRGEELPVGDFFIHKIDFAQPCDLVDQEWDELAGLTRILNLTFQDPQLTESGVDQMTRLPTLRFLELRFDDVAPNGLSQLSRLPSVRNLYLFGSQVGDIDIETVSHLTHVNWLALNSPHLTDSCLTLVARMQQLEYLHLLQMKRISDEGLGSLREMPHLTQLFATGASITNEGLHHLLALRQLEWLNLDATLISDDGLKQIAKMVWLRRLTVARTQITNHGVATLRPLTNLQHLDLAGTRITDAAVDDLAAFAQMKDLRVGDRLSAEAVESLRLRMPTCTISTSQ